MDLVFLKKNDRPEKHLWLSALPGYEPQGQNKNNLGSCPLLGFCSVCTPLHIFVSPINPTASVLCRESLSSFHNLSHCSIKRHLVFSPSLRPVRPRLGRRRLLRNRPAATNTKSTTPTTRSLSSLSLHNHHSNNNYGGTGLLSTPIILSLLLSTSLSDDHPLLRRLRL